jgi:hypothetical protein
LQAQLGKLSESGYLEDLAREQLTYALPGEDLYIVKQPEDADGGEVSATESESQPAETTATTAGGASAAQTSVGADAPSGADVAGALETSGEQARLPQPGFFERVLMAIAALF